MQHDVITLVRELYALRQAGKISDAEARWVLQIVLPDYGLTLDDLARWLGAR